MVVVDATILLLMLRPDTPVPPAPDGLPISKPRERIEELVRKLDAADIKIVIPTPVLSEALVRAGARASQEIVDHLQKYSAFRIEPFDARAAIELAAMTRNALAKGSKRGDSKATWAKLKFDQQIVAIAKVCGATEVYSDDSEVKATAKELGIPVIGLAELPLPPDSSQPKLDLGLSSEDRQTTGDLFHQTQSSRGSTKSDE